MTVPAQAGLSVDMPLSNALGGIFFARANRQ